MTKLPLISINVSSGTWNNFIDEITSIAINKKSQYVCIANAHMLVEAYKDSTFANIVNNAKIITPDGMPLTWAVRMFYKIKQDRISGMDLLPALLTQAVLLKLPVFFYGGTSQMLDKTKSYLNENFHGIKVAGTYSPPFGKTTVEEENKIVEIINASGAAFVFVVLGCPKQERWMASMKERINAVMIGVGGALPVMIRMQKRAPSWMQYSGLEWFYRFLLEPRRLFKRYAITNSIFIFLVLKEIYDKRRHITLFNFD